MSASRSDVEAEYMHGDSLPWIPFTPVSEKLLLKYFRIDPLHGEILVSVRFLPGQAGALYNTGPLIAYTLKGAWRFREHDWVSKDGDMVHEAAGSMHTAESVGETETVVFLVVTGELLFFDEEGSLVWQESWKTSMERYAQYCAERQLSERDLTGFVGRPLGH